MVLIGVSPDQILTFVIKLTNKLSESTHNNKGELVSDDIKKINDGIYYD